ncbi:hypothetical protein M5K25_019022 [Dendrobium thyrsiflorum]|uniref:Uncharacterized protein n=1 Tax=Dendrobium thyrsiflorum TaxID=117978 RepID=A0ABD0UKN2_DENTH
MADPERDFGIVYDDQGFIQILQSLFFDVDLEVDHTVNDYIDRILETVVLAVEDQLGTVEWHLAADPKLVAGVEQKRTREDQAEEVVSVVDQSKGRGRGVYQVARDSTVIGLAARFESVEEARSRAWLR